MNEDKQRSQEISVSMAEEAHIEDGKTHLFTLLEDLHVGMMICGPDGKVLALNQAICTLMGISRDYMLGKTWRDWDIYDAQGVLIPYSDRLVPRVLATRQPIHDEVVLVVHPETGEKRWLLVDMQPLLTPAGEIDRIFATLTNITMQLQTEEALRLREQEAHDFQEQLKTLHEVSLILAQADSPDTLCRRAIELGRERFGFDRLSLWLIADDPNMLEGTYGTDEAGCIRAEHWQTMRSTPSSRQILFANAPVKVATDWPLCNVHGEKVGQGWHMMASLRDGTDVIGVLNVDNFLRHRPLHDYEVELIGLYGAIVGHLYARLQREKALQEREERFRAAVTGSNDGLYDVDLKTGFVYYSPRFLELLGYSDHADELPPHISEFEKRIHPEDRAGALQRMQESISQRTPFHAEYRLRCRNGDYCWFQFRSNIQCDALGQPMRLAGFLTDITASKRQITLMEQTNRAAHIGGWEYELATGNFYWTEETYRIHETDPAEYSPSWQSARAFFTPESALILEDAIRCALDTGEGYNLDLDMVTAKNHTISVKVIGNTLMDTGKVTRLFGAIQDITRSKQAEMAQRESEAKFRAIFAGAAAGIVLLDMNGCLMMTNPAMQEMLGYSEETLQGMAFVEFTHPDDIALSRSLYRAVTEGRQDSYQIEKRYIRKDGRVIWCQSAVFLVRDGAGAPQFAVGMAVNITERKIAEESLQDSLKRMHTLTSHLQSVREEERSRVAREVHDELGQALTGLKLELAWLKRHTKHPAETVHTEMLLEKMDAMNSLIETTIKSVRRIATELRPVILDTFGLIPALEWQAQDFQSRTGISCSFFSELDTAPLDQEQTTAVFRIAQESLTNVLRHAKAASVKVRLESRDEMLILIIKDNGIGMQKSKDKAVQSFGLLGMRERALLLGGDIEIVGKPHQGTTVRLQIPIRKREDTSTSSVSQSAGL